MITMTIALAAACGAFSAFRWGFDLGAGWSIFAGTCAFVTVQAVVGLKYRRSAEAVAKNVQSMMLSGRSNAEAKMKRWQFAPPGSMKEAQRELERDARAVTLSAIKASSELLRWKGWVPFVERQVATMQLHMRWAMKDFNEVDRLMDKAIMAGPEAVALKLARMHMLGRDIGEMRKVHEKGARRAKYNGYVLPDACFSWILVKRGLADEAFKLLGDAVNRSDNETLKNNRLHLMNGRQEHFSNSGLGDIWWSLHLEEPKMKPPRQHRRYR